MGNWGSILLELSEEPYVLQMYYIERASESFEQDMDEESTYSPVPMPH